jgi:hypothetical protein
VTPDSHVTLGNAVKVAARVITVKTACVTAALVTGLTFADTKEKLRFLSLWIEGTAQMLKPKAFPVALHETYSFEHRPGGQRQGDVIELHQTALVV